MALSWPAIVSLTPLVFFSLIPLLFIEDHYFNRRKLTNGRGMLKYLYLAFVIWNALTTWWIGCVDESLMTRAFSVGGAVLCNAMFMAIVWGLFHYTRRKVGSREGYFALVFYWLAFEYIHLQWDLSWPWLTLGNVFANNVEWIQWYDVSGVFGGSLWVLLVNLSAFFVIRRAIRANRVAPLPTTIMLILILVPILLSKIEYRGYTEAEDPVEVVIVQPNVDPYNEKFGTLTPEDQLERMLQLAEAQVDQNTDYVVFPETALQEMHNIYQRPDGELGIIGLWENDLEASLSVQRLRQFLEDKKGLNVVIGMSSAYLFDKNEPLSKTARFLKASGRYYDAYNAALYIDSNGDLHVHHKSKLVIGVELIPFTGLIKGLGDLAIDLGGTSGSLGSQDHRSNFVDPQGHSVTPAICYESVYGEYVGEYLKGGSDLLFIITNDGWWQDTPGYEQHLAYARLRAIEHRRSIARSANTGVSCFIDQKGDLHERTNWWEKAVIKGTMNASSEQTFYTEHGDQIARASVFLAVLLLIYSWVQAIRKRSRVA